MFNGRKMVIATKHGKEAVIAPLFEEALGVHCIVPEGLDTDLLGTFTGEITREQDPLATARKKCLLALEQSICDLAIASEGSFGPHPSSIFLSANEELLLLLDKRHSLEIVVREISTATNFSGQEVSSLSELLDFAQRARFPSHALILRKHRNEGKHLIKGIQTTAQLEQAFQELSQGSKTVYVETDMRAMHNPSRMQVIAAAARQLLQKVQSRCPQCHKPGFSVVAALPGLPCGLCGAATRSTLLYRYGCQHCHFSQEAYYPHQKKSEDPMYCDYCNP